MKQAAVIHRIYLLRSVFAQVNHYKHSCQNKAELCSCPLGDLMYEAKYIIDFNFSRGEVTL